MGRTELEIVDMLADIEERVSRLYEIYAQKYPKYRDLWNDLVKEEEGHARLIRDLKRHVEKGTLRFNSDRCNKRAVGLVLDYVGERFNKARTREIDMRDAFFSALQIEKNVLEKDFCSFFEGESEELKKACATITDETSQHRNKIKEIFESLSR